LTESETFLSHKRTSLVRETRLIGVLKRLMVQRLGHNIQSNDNQPNNTQQKELISDIEHNDTQDNDTQHNETHPLG
jgi:hypothetical protein